MKIKTEGLNLSIRLYILLKIGEIKINFINLSRKYNIIKEKSNKKIILPKDLTPKRKNLSNSCKLLDLCCQSEKVKYNNGGVYVKINL